MGFVDRLQHGWNAFLNRDPTKNYDIDPGYSYSTRPDRPVFTRGNEKSIVTAVYNRIAIDVSAIEIKHVKLDDNDRYLEEVRDGLDNCLTTEANIDQTGRAFIQDIVMSMLDEGCVAVIPIDTTINPDASGSFEVNTLRTGKIVEWKPQSVKVKVYNDKTGKKEEIWVLKKTTGIIESPFYSVMNEPNSTAQRLKRKLMLLDKVDEQTSSGKLDMIIQLPYIIKTDARRQQAEQRRNDIERQLSSSNYGIAYTDGTEKITQLNRSLDNNLLSQVEKLTEQLYGQLGINQDILNGKADDATMLNYYNQTIEPIISTITDEMKRKFLTKTARSQKHSIEFFRDPFRLVPVSNIADIADKFTRNEIMTSNEIRQIIGMKPSQDPNADVLRNKNLNQTAGEEMGEIPTGDDAELEGESDGGMAEDEYQQQMAQLDANDAELDSLENELNHGVFDDDDFLEHYASPYYDPVKAHEYYMKNRELKGRTSTATLNDKGKEAAKYVHEQIKNEKKDKTDAAREATKNAKKAKSEALKNEIASIRESLKGMSKAERDANKDSINQKIKSMREANKAAREQLSEEYKATAGALKDEADNKYVSELEKIRATPAFIKAKKGRKKKSSK